MGGGCLLPLIKNILPKLIKNSLFGSASNAKLRVGAKPFELSSYPHMLPL
jgi:hypothetical protein